MDNSPIKNPIALHIIDTNLLSDKPFPIEQNLLFAGSIPENIRKAIQDRNKPVMQDYYGKEKGEDLLRLLPVAGSKGGAEEVEFNELDDIFDISELEDKPKKDKKPVKPTKPGEEITDVPESLEISRDSEVVLEPAPTRKAHLKVSALFAYPEDRISEFKNKIYLETGIPPYKQYLCVKFNENFIPMYYHIIANGMINIDIQKSLNISTKILGIPVDTNFFNDKDQVLIEAGDMFFTIQDVQNSFRTTTFYLFNIDSILGPSKRVLDEMVRTEPDQIELLYYGFVIKYWPMMTYNIFLQYLSNEKLIPKSYPDLSPSVDKLRGKIRSESAILNEKYALLNSKDPRISKPLSLYSPQVGVFDKPTPGSVVDTAIKSATIIVKEKSWESNRVGLEFSGKTKMNVRNLFYHSHVSKDIPIIRVRLIISNQIITITKIRSPTLNDSDDIKRVYDQVRMRIHLPYFNAIMFVVRLAGSDSRFVTLTIRDNGRYEVKSVWNEDDKMNFKVLVDSISKSVNPHIERINNMGRTVFQGGMQLSTIQDTTVTFSDLNMAIFWKKSLVSSEFLIIVANLKKRLESEIIKFVESPESVSGLIQYVLIKGMTHESLIGAYKNLLVSNYYEYLSDAKVKQKWFQLFSLGRQVVITHRTTDVKIDVEDLKEKEFKYFYDHIITLLFESEREFKESRAKAKLAKPGKPGKPGKERISTKGTNLLKVLKGKDPELFNFKKYGSDIVYSRKCQKDHQPIPYSVEEYESLSVENKKRAVKFWNFTSETPMYYICPNNKFPHMSFIVGQHPKGYCLPCCKKTPSFSYELQGSDDKSDGKPTKKENIYETCLKNYSYTEEDSDIGPSRYIMNYGKIIDTGRVGKLPDVIDKWILYNMEEDIMVRSQPDSTVQFQGKEFSVNKLWKITKNNKARLIPVSILAPQLEQKSWSHERINKARLAKDRMDSAKGATRTIQMDKEYTPKEVMEKPNLSPDHYNRVLNVDTSYPIIVYRNINEGWQVVLDGLHRLSKAAYVDKDDMITVKYITHNQLAKSEIQVRQVKDIGRKLMVKKALKKPGYYLFGITQNSPFVDNVGAGYSIAMAMGKSMARFIMETVKILKETNIYLSLLDGHIIKHFRDKSELINSLLILFGETSSKGSINSKFDKWNELFIDLSRLCFNIYVVVLEDVAGSVNLNLPIKVNSVDDIFPRRTEINASADISVEYIFLFKRSKKTRVLYSIGNLYYPIFVITPQEFFKNMNIDKRLYNQNDEIVNLSRNLVEQMYSGKEGDIIEKDFNLKAVLSFSEGTNGTQETKGTLGTIRLLSKLYVNTKGMCYAVAFPGAAGKEIIIPVKYSSIDNIPGKYFVDEKRKIVYNPISSFESNNVKNMKEFIMNYNSWVVEISEAKGMTRTYTDIDKKVRGMHELNKKELRVSPIFPLIKIEELLVSTTGKTRDTVVGFVSNGLRYYMVSSMSRKEFYKHMSSGSSGSSGYNAISEKVDSEEEMGIFYLRYDPTVMNKIIFEHQNEETKDIQKKDPNMRDISKIVYEKHLYYLFTSELMAYLDQERNAAVRKKIMNLITSEDLRGRSEFIYNSLQTILLPDYPEDLQRIEEMLSQYYTSHYDRKTFIREVEKMTYQFDRMTLIQLKNASEYFYGYNKQQREFKLTEIQKIIKNISEKFVIKKTPTFTDETLYLTECESDLGKDVPYCEKGKLMIPGKKLNSFIEIFAEEVVNPLRRDYILSAVYISEIIDIYKFPKVPGEELYVKFG